MGRVIEVYKGRDDLVRSAVKTSKGVVFRAVQRLYDLGVD